MTPSAGIKWPHDPSVRYVVLEKDNEENIYDHKGLLRRSSCNVLLPKVYMVIETEASLKECSLLYEAHFILKWARFLECTHYVVKKF